MYKSLTPIGESEYDAPSGERLPYIVLIIKCFDEVFV
jgi:hypothetical protein